MNSITNHQGNANQNHNKTPFHTSQNNYYQKVKVTCVGEMWRKGSPRALLVGLQTGAAPMENSMEIAQNTKNRYTILPSNSTSG